MTGILGHAIRFADLWATDHHQMVDEIYSPTIHMESMCHLDRRPIETGKDLHQLEDRLAAMIPEHRHELVRVIADDWHACLETTVASPTTVEYAPACLWWWMDRDGLVADEVGFFDWERRTGNSRRSHGTVPPNDGRRRRSAVVDALVDALETGDLSKHLAPGCTVEDVGVGPCELALEPVEVVETVVGGAVFAALVVGRGANRIWRGTVVLTVDADDAVVSVRQYRDAAACADPGAIHPSQRLARRLTRP